MEPIKLVYGPGCRRHAGDMVGEIRLYHSGTHAVGRLTRGVDGTPVIVKIDNMKSRPPEFMDDVLRRYCVEADTPGAYERAVDCFKNYRNITDEYARSVAWCAASMVFAQLPEDEKWQALADALS